MTPNTLFYAIALLMSTALIGCANGQKTSTSSGNQQGSAASIELPPLEDGQSIIFEDEDLRVIKPEQREESIDYLLIQAKDSKYHSFNIEGEKLEIEEFVGDYIILSDGEDDVVTLVVYDLRTGKRIALVDQYMRGLMQVEGTDTLNVLIFDKNFPLVEWLPESATWRYINDTPSDLDARLPEVKERCKDRLKECFRLMAYRKVRILIKEHRVEYLNEHEWDYAY